MSIRSFVVAGLLAFAVSLPVTLAIVGSAIAAPQPPQESTLVPAPELPMLIEFDAELPSHEDAPAVIVIPMTVTGSAPKAAAKSVQFKQPVLQFIDRGRYGFAG